MDLLVRVEKMCVLSPGQQQHALLVAVGVEENMVLEDEGIAGVVLTQGGFHEDEDAVVAEDLHVVEGDARSAIHVDAESGGRAAFQGDVNAHGVVVVVAHGEALGHRAHRGEDGVEEHRVGREGERGTGVVGEDLVLAAGGEEEGQEGGDQEEPGAHAGGKDGRAKYAEAGRIIALVWWSGAERLVFAWLRNQAKRAPTWKYAWLRSQAFRAQAVPKRPGRE